MSLNRWARYLRKGTTTEKQSLLLTEAESEKSTNKKQAPLSSEVNMLIGLNSIDAQLANTSLLNLSNTIRFMARVLSMAPAKITNPQTFTPIALSIQRNAETTIVSIKRDGIKRILTFQKTPNYLPVTDLVFNDQVNNGTFKYFDEASSMNFLGTNRNAFAFMTQNFYDPSMFPALHKISESLTVNAFMEKTKYKIENEIANYSEWFHPGIAIRFFLTLLTVVGIICVTTGSTVTQNQRNNAFNKTHNSWQNVYDNCHNITVTCNGDAFMFLDQGLSHPYCNWVIPLSPVACEGAYGPPGVVFASSCEDLNTKVGCDLNACKTQHDECDTAAGLKDRYDALIGIGSTLLALGAVASCITYPCVFITKEKTRKQFAESLWEDPFPYYTSSASITRILSLSDDSKSISNREIIARAKERKAQLLIESCPPKKEFTKADNAIGSRLFFAAEENNNKTQQNINTPSQSEVRINLGIN